MKIIACCKAVPEEQDILVHEDGTLDFDRVAWKVGSYDLNAIEAARQLADAVGGQAVGLSVGGSALDASKLRKDILSRGLDSLVAVKVDDPEQLDTFGTAQVLAAAIRQQGDVDLVLCGAGSSDEYAQQVGNQLGALLGVATLNAVNKIEAGAAHNPSTVIVERVLESQVQSIEVSLPAVLSLSSSINNPRIAGMKDILAAGKKQTAVSDPASLGLPGSPAASTAVVSVLAPSQAVRAGEVYEGDAADVSARLAEILNTKLR